MAFSTKNRAPSRVSAIFTGAGIPSKSNYPSQVDDSKTNDFTAEVFFKIRI
jgi:hypothetical protein